MDIFQKHSQNTNNNASTLKYCLRHGLELLATLLGSNLGVALGTRPAQRLPPFLTTGQRPPKDIHKLAHLLAAALDLGLGRLAALGALDPLREGTKARQGHDCSGVLCLCIWCLVGQRVVSCEHRGGFI